MAYEVVDRRGRVIKLRDDQPCPDGCTLRLPVYLKDSVQREVAELSDAEAAAMRAGEAWDAYRRRLGTPKARRMALPPTPPWQAPQRDSAPRDYAVTDEMVQSCVDARQEYIDRISYGMNRHRVEDDADDIVLHMDDEGFSPGAYAREKYIQRISDAWRSSREE